MDTQENKTKAVMINVYCNYPENKNYSFKFLVREYDSTMSLAFIISLIPDKEMMTLKVDKTPMGLVDSSLIMTTMQMEDIIDKAFGIKHMGLVMEKGENNEQI